MNSLLFIKIKINVMSIFQQTLCVRVCVCACVQNSSAVSLTSFLYVFSFEKTSRITETDAHVHGYRYIVRSRVKCKYVF